MTNFDPRTVHPYQAQQFGTPRPDAAPFPGRTVPGPVPPPPPSKPPRGKRPLATKVITGLIAAGLVAGGAGTWIALSGSSAEAAIQTTSFAGADPTTSPFGTDAPQVAAVAATGPQVGDTANLYAATTPPSCDTTSFLAQLQADPAKLAAFGGVFAVQAGDVPAFVNSLSPVVLRANTAVTDHPYVDGAFVEHPAVLAAGTAVLVDSYGLPTVKCFNGNPLTPGPAATDAVTVTPSAAAVTQFRFSTVDNRGTVTVPGKPDVPHRTLTARYNYDGSVLLSDGTILNPDGSVRAPKAAIPAGGVVNPDGSVTVGGKTFNPDGTERTTITIPPQTIQLPVGGTTTVPGFTIRADGTAVDDKGAPITPQPKVIFNYDGTATVISGNDVVVWGQDGNFKSKFTAVAPDKVNPDGSITKGDGTIVNPDGSTKRTPVKLPGHKTLDPNGGDDKATKDGKPATDGQAPTGTGTTGTGTTGTENCGAVLADGTKVCPPAGSTSSATGSTTGTSTTGTSTSGTSTSGTSTSGTGSSTKGTDSGSTSSSGSTGSGSSNSSSGGTQNTTKEGTNG